MTQKSDKKNVTFSFENTKDFPELGVTSRKYNIKSHRENETAKSITCQAWLPVIHSSKVKNYSLVAFPELPVAKSCKINDNANEKPDKSMLKNSSVLIRQENEETEVEDEKVKKKGKELQASRKPLNLPRKNPNKKKRADPIFLNLNDIIEINKNVKKIVQNKRPKSKFHRYKDKENLSGNYLDSSNPKRSRGKHREIKKKKLTKLKFLIVKERIIKQKVREQYVAEYLGKEYTDLIENIDFGVEIKKYLNEVKKNSDSEQKKNDLKDNFNASSNNDVEKLKIKKSKMNERNNQQSVNSLKTEPVMTLKKKIQFSSKWREYCDNLITPGLNAAVNEFIKELVNLQDKLFARDPIKAKVKKRHVSGFKEIKKHLTMKKVKMIIIAPNLEKLQMQGSVYDLISEIKSLAISQEVPYVFALDRYKLGRCAKKTVPVSAFAVLNYEGIEKLYDLVVQEINQAKKLFSDLSEENIKNEENERKQADVTSEVICSFITKFNEGLQVSDD